MKMKDYEKILKDNLRQSATKLGLGWLFVFQHDNDSKHTPLLGKNYLQVSKVNIIQGFICHILNYTEYNQ